MRPPITRKEISYPLSFRVPFAQVEEIDRAVERERRKRRSDLLETIWNIAWTNYQRRDKFGLIKRLRLERLSYRSQFQLVNCSRRAIFLNLPTEVRGMASRKTKASGSCHLAKVSARKARNSSGVAFAPAFKTTAASGRSCHFGWGMPTTQASFTAG